MACFGTHPPIRSVVIHFVLVVILLGWFSPFASSVDDAPSSCPASLVASRSTFCQDSLSVSFWSADTTPETDWRNHVFNVGDVVHFMASIVEGSKDEFSVAEIMGVNVHGFFPVKNKRRKRPSSFMLLGLLPSAGTPTPAGKTCNFALDSRSDSESDWRGFHFELEKSAFDFRMYEGQKDVVVDLLVFVRVRGPRPRDFFEVSKSVRIRVGGFENEGFEHEIHVRTPNERYPLWVFLSENADSHRYHTGKEVSRSSANLFWYHNPDKFQKDRVRLEAESFYSQHYVAVNHFADELLIGNKDYLTQTLRKREEEASFFYPKTYVLAEEMDEFLSMVTESQEDEHWIMKLPHLSGGKGVRFFTKVAGQYFLDGNVELQSPDELFDHLKKEHHAKDLSGDRGFIAQKYVANPLLYEGHKMEIRQYWLIASVLPLRVLHYDPGVGLCLCSSQQYRMEDFDRIGIHLTNAAAQPKGSSGPKPTLVRDLEQYFDDQLQPLGFVETIRRQTRNVLKNVALALNESISDFAPYQKNHQYGLMAADFLMDAEDHRLWLNEVQLGFGLFHKGDLAINLSYFPDMFVESLDIVEELRRYEEMHGSSYGLNLESVRKFEWLIGGPNEN